MLKRIVLSRLFRLKRAIGYFRQHNKIHKAPTVHKDHLREEQSHLTVDKGHVPMAQKSPLPSADLSYHVNESLGNSSPDSLPCSEQPRRTSYAVSLGHESSNDESHTSKQVQSFNVACFSSPVNMSKHEYLNPVQEHPASRPHLPPGPGPGSTIQSELLGLDNAIGLTASPPAPPPLSYDKEWAKIKHLRVEVWSKRSKIQEMRRLLRDKQLSKAAADDHYFQFVRLRGHGIHFGGYDTLDEQRTLETLLQACESARNEYGPLEDDCNLLESRLSVQEFELDRLERKLYDRLLDPQSYSSDHHNLAFDSPSSSSSSDNEGDQQLHPLVLDYQSKVGDVEIIRERLDELLEEKYNLEEERERRHRVNRELGEDELQWLENYFATEEILIDKFESTEREAEQLKQKCLTDNLIDKAGNPTNFEQREQKSLDIVAGSETSVFVNFPILIPEPGSKQALVQASGVDEGTMWHESSSRIDWWLLDQLRMSPMDVNLLARTYVSQFGPIDEREQWQWDVLDYWYVDGARNSRPGPQTSTGISLFTQAAIRSGRPSNDIEFSSYDRHTTIAFKDSQQLGDSDIASVQSSENESIVAAPRPNPVLGDC